jgi:S-adenosylmethionine decarboxylase
VSHDKALAVPLGVTYVADPPHVPAEQEHAVLLARSTTVPTIGSHWILEMYDCPPEVIDDLEHVRVALREAVKAARATLLHEAAHAFEPQGVTALGLLAESHISVHTRPGAGYAAVDVYTCGACRPDRAVPVLARRLEAGHVETLAIERGLEGPRRMLVKTHASRSAAELASPVGSQTGPSLRAALGEAVP